MQSSNQGQKKICIVGGGASGLATAYFLENDYEVTLFERRQRLGGHAHTNYFEHEGHIIPVEIGCEFFSRKAFPTFLQLLKILGIATRPCPVNYTFYNAVTNRAVCVPPFRKEGVVWDTLLPGNLINLIQMGYAVHSSRKVIAARDTALTMEQFIDRLWVTDRFKKEFFFPFLAAGWGANPVDFRKFACYNILSWSYVHRMQGLKPYIWEEIVDGVSGYINRIASLSSKTTRYLGTTVERVERTGDGYTLHSSDGRATYCDYLVIATSAYDSQKLLRGVPGMEQVQEKLSKIEYLTAHIALHSDVSVLHPDPKKWSVVNVKYDGSCSRLTVYKRNLGTLPVFRSWVDPQVFVPKNAYIIEPFYHAKPTSAYFAGQKAVKESQGKQNIWFGGLYTHDLDSHESAIVAALKTGQKLAPQAERVRQLQLSTEPLLPG
ncbi:MAG TPA: FAD-dependent oxidoreductase [Candidatus Limnocylindria bacterium]|nr:FAD-dependent oxidoreductase [Candidatus Limnocylindria bacterium]